MTPSSSQSTTSPRPPTRARRGKLHTWPPASGKLLENTGLRRDHLHTGSAFPTKGKVKFIRAPPAHAHRAKAAEQSKDG